MSAWSTQTQAPSGSFPPPPVYQQPQGTSAPNDHERPTLQSSASEGKYTPAYARRRSSASTHGLTPPMMYGSSPSQHGTGDYLHPSEAAERYEPTAPYSGADTEFSQHYTTHDPGMPPGAIPQQQQSQQLVPRRTSYSSSYQPSSSRRSSHHGLSPPASRHDDMYAAAPTTTGSLPYDPQRRPSAASHRSQRSQRSRRSQRDATPERVSMGDTLMMLFGWTKHLMPARRH